jgi:hypothetical protein
MSPYLLMVIYAVVLAYAYAVVLYPFIITMAGETRK